ncbi:MAG: hypothetical protein ACYS0K_23755 [Planctomycetota bacterium]
MKYFARSALLGLALALPACGAAVAALVDEVTKAIEDDGSGNSLVVAGTGLVAIDLPTGDREVVTDADVGTGTALVDPRALAFDEAGSLCLVWDAGRGAVIAVDVLTGDRTLLSSATRGTGPTLTSVRALAFDAARDRLLAADVGATETVLVAVDLVTGNRTVLTGAGTALELPRSMVVDGDRALVGDASLRAIVTVDLATGDRNLLSDSAHGQGPLFVSPNGLALMGGHVLVLDASLNTLFSVDLANGDRAVVSGGGVGLGVGFSSPVGLAFNPAAWEALVTQQTPAQVLLMDADPLTGDRGVVASAAIGLGPVLAYPAGIAFDAARARVIVLNRATP